MASAVGTLDWTLCRGHDLMRARTSCLHYKQTLCKDSRGIKTAYPARVRHTAEACLAWLRKRSVLELAMQQSGTAAARAAAEDASGSGKEGSSAGILKVWRLHCTF